MSNYPHVKEVESLIPHRDPFLYVDKIVSAMPEQIIGTKIFSDADQFLRGSFPEFRFVPGTILIEALAQCGGAGIKKMGLASGFFGFANIENANFLMGVEFGKEFTMVIRNVKIAERYIKQHGVGEVEGERCVELTCTCVKFQ
jgi:3-hydroxyacyl-[acyl-carrier-protein] dehydratase